MPEWIDRIVIVDDCSTDATVSIVEEHQRSDDRIILLRHETNSGVGAAMATGYKWARDNEYDVAVRMDGDGQMDPADLPSIIDPVVEGRADYSKGNRLFTGEAFKKIPKVRYFGNMALSFLTKLASGYWHIADSQSGYTAISKTALQLIDWDRMYKHYGQPNDLLVRLNVYHLRVTDVPVEPVYNIGEKSGIRIFSVLPRISWLLIRGFIWRLKEKYIIRDFHPLIFFYLLGILSIFVSIGFLIRVLVLWYQNGAIPEISVLGLMFFGFTGLQSIFFAMWFDMDFNRDLK